MQFKPTPFVHVNTLNQVLSLCCNTLTSNVPPMDSDPNLESNFWEHSLSSLQKLKSDEAKIGTSTDWSIGGLAFILFSLTANCTLNQLPQTG